MAMAHVLKRTAVITLATVGMAVALTRLGVWLLTLVHVPVWVGLIPLFFICWIGATSAVVWNLFDTAYQRWWCRHFGL
jgi:hypothetical protein